MKPDERENMPIIDSAAYKIHQNNDPKYIQNQIKQTKHIPDQQTCETCQKLYNQTETSKVLSTIPTITGFNYDNICLACIQQNSQDMKASYQPDLEETREILTEMNGKYQIAHNNYHLIANKHQKYDYQSVMISHHIRQAQQAELDKQAKANKKTITKKSSKQIKKATAMKILSNLIDEQQKAILALIAKQS